MSERGDLSDVLDRWVLSTAQQRTLRLVVLAGGLGFLALVPLAGGDSHPVLSAGIVLVAVVAAAAPGSHASAALLLSLVALWVVTTPERLDGWTLAAAALLLVVHLAATLVSHGPPGLTLGRSVVRLWAGRGALCLLAAPVVLVVGLALQRWRPGGAETALWLALLATLAWCALVAVRVVRRH